RPTAELMAVVHADHEVVAGLSRERRFGGELVEVKPAGSEVAGHALEQDVESSETRVVGIVRVEPVGDAQGVQAVSRRQRTDDRLDPAHERARLETFPGETD